MNVLLWLLVPLAATVLVVLAIRSRDDEFAAPNKRDRALGLMARWYDPAADPVTKPKPESERPHQGSVVKFDDTPGPDPQEVSNASK